MRHSDRIAADRSNSADAGSAEPKVDIFDPSSRQFDRRVGTVTKRFKRCSGQRKPICRMTSIQRSTPRTPPAIAKAPLTQASDATERQPFAGRRREAAVDGTRLIVPWADTMPWRRSPGASRIEP
jgi:hypothetical protein